MTEEERERRDNWNQVAAGQQLRRQTERTNLIQKKIRLMTIKSKASVEFIRSPKWNELNQQIAEINAKLVTL